MMQYSAFRLGSGSVSQRRRQDSFLRGQGRSPHDTAATRLSMVPYPFELDATYTSRSVSAVKQGSLRGPAARRRPHRQAFARS
jgi:hypothetical protein